MKHAEQPVPPFLLERDEAIGTASELPPQPMDADSAVSDEGEGSEQPCPRIYALGTLPTLPWGELQRRVAEGMLAQPGEHLAAYDARVRADRLARGVALGLYFEEQPFVEENAMPSFSAPSCAWRRQPTGARRWRLS
jgi:hypothetical protein